jgi:hypothetical protein
MRNTNRYFIGGMLVLILGIVAYFMMEKKSAENMSQAGNVATSMDVEAETEEGAFGEEEMGMATEEGVEDPITLTEEDVEVE